MNKKQVCFLRDAYKAITTIQDTNEVMILLPANGEIPESKFELDVVYITRLQKERLEK